MHTREGSMIVAALAVCLLASLTAMPAVAQPVASFRSARVVVPTSPVGATGVAVDGSGNVYVADYLHSRVLKETVSGGSYTESVVASGTAPNSRPSGVAVDQSGNLYIAYNYGPNYYGPGAVVKETLSGGSYTRSVVFSDGSGYPGGGSGYPEGVAVDGSGNVYITENIGGSSPHGRVLKATPSGNSYQTAVVVDGQPWFQLGSSLAVDGMGALYFATGDRVLKETPLAGGGYTESVVKDKVGNYSFWSVAVDRNYNLYISFTDYISRGVFAGKILKETPAPAGESYTESVVASAGLNRPFYGIAVDGGGNIYGSYDHRSVLKVMPNSVDFGTWPVGGASSSFQLEFAFNAAATLNSPTPYQVLTMGASNKDFIDAGAATCNAGASFNAGDTCVVNVTFAPILAGTRKGAVPLIDATGAVIATAYLLGGGKAPQITFSPGTQSIVSKRDQGYYATAVDGNGNVYMVDNKSHSLWVATPSSGGYSNERLIYQCGQYCPYGIAIDGSGNIYMADFNHNVVLKETLSGGSYTESVVAGNTSGFASLFSPNDVAVDGSGNIYIADTGSRRVLKEFFSGGSYAATFAFSFTHPIVDVAADGSGNVYMSGLDSSGSGRVWKAAPRGDGFYVMSTVADSVSNGLSNPHGVTVDGSGNVYIADSANNRVLKETPSANGYVQSVVAEGSDWTAYVAVDGNANVYIASSVGLLKQDLADPPSLTFGAVNAGTASAAQPVQVINNGNATLTLAGLDVSPKFTLAAGSGTPQDCAVNLSIAPGAACNLNIRFSPAASDAGPVSGSITLTDNNLNTSAAVQQIPLSGIALGTQTITFPSPATQTYGAAPITLTATATSGLAVTYSVISGPATVNGSTLTITGAGSVTVQAGQPGSVYYQAASPVRVTFTVNKANTTTSLTSGPNPSFQYQTVNLVAAVQGQYGGAVTGTVTFMEGTTKVLGSATTVNGSAILALSTLGVGSHTITAVYGGDLNDNGSTSPAITQNVVSKSATTTSIASSPNPSFVGQSVTLTATVSPSAATGTVSFFQGQTELGSGTLSAGKASFSTSSLLSGSLAITAVYGGDTPYNGSSSARLTQTVNKGTTSTTITSAPNPSNAGQSVTFTATVTWTPPYGGPPAGPVSFMVGNTTLGTGPLNSTGVATFSTSTLSAGKYNVKAVYAGSSAYTGSSSGTVTQTVK